MPSPLGVAELAQPSHKECVVQVLRVMDWLPLVLVASVRAAGSDGVGTFSCTLHGAMFPARSECDEAAAEQESGGGFGYGCYVECEFHGGICKTLLR